jgi:aminoglycoside/choline kinase family phosphotransferase
MGIEEEISRVCREWSGSDELKPDKIAGSGSYRQYFRIHLPSQSVIGVYNEDIRENSAFLEFTGHFRAKGLPVPQILYADPGKKIYFLEDLGDLSLFGLLNRVPANDERINAAVREVYFKVVDILPEFQIRAGDDVPFEFCYPRPAFDRQSMMWDLNYFKYYFLKLARIAFDEQKLEEDFNALTGFLLEVPQDHFMYRDFQSRNIMIVKDSPWFIDYQGGRKGALQYDLASLLYDAKADLPEDFRVQLLDRYIDSAARLKGFDDRSFRKYFDGFVLIRILQAMGAYGFRGYYENKPLFLQSIPYAVRNLRILLERGRLPVRMPMLMQVLAEIIGHPAYSGAKKETSSLRVRVFSFSYKKGLPADGSGNGGGFVFDCRAIPNPGRYKEYASLTGKDKAVIDFLRKEPEAEMFLNHAFSIVGQSVRNYMERGFSDLMVSFGCTGGQHRSVYCAEEMTRYLKERFNVIIETSHVELKV